MTLGYRLNPGGLNNQKLALFGLLEAARRGRAPVVLPELCALEAGRGVAVPVPLGQVFDVARLRCFAAAHGIEVLDAPAAGEVGGWGYFEAGAGSLSGAEHAGRLRSDAFVQGFFRAMRPLLAGSTLLADLRAALLDRAEAVLQLRIERDWVEHVRLHLGRGLVPGTEDYAPGFEAILAKVAATLPEATRLLVVCDEDDLPVPKEVIRAHAAARHGVALSWKSDVIPGATWAALDPLARSVLDFELARAAPVFVGTTRSTFANMLAMETAGAGPVHLVWNALGPGLRRRWDQGGCAEAEAATNRVRERAALVPVGAGAHGLRLVAHVSGFGDIASEDTLAAGAPGRVIEGFAVEAVAADAMGVEYRALLAGGVWTGWSAAGTFVGSRGRAEAILGFGVRGFGVRAIAAGRFAGSHAVVAVADGEDCVGGPGLALEAMQVGLSVGDRDG